MAILKKGIISAPSGKIGSLMAYRRKGQDIISRPPIVKNAAKTTWNLYRNELRQAWYDIFDVLPTGVVTRWEVFFNSSEDLVSKSFDLNIQYASAFYSQSLYNFALFPPINIVFHRLEYSINNATRVLTIKYDSFLDPFFALGVPFIVVQRLRYNGATNALINTNLVFVNGFADIQLGSYDQSQYAYLYFRIAVNPPLTNSQAYIVDFREALINA